MVDDIITGLSRIKWLFVIARNSSFTYRERTIDVKQVGRELGVRYVLEGSVRKVSDRVRINAQLIDAVSGVHVWAERYDRKFEDIFVLQDEISLSVVGAIEPSLRQAEVERVKRKRPDSLDAYDLVLRAQPDIYSGMPERSARALPLLERVLALDPTYALAHGFAAMGYLRSIRARSGASERRNPSDRPSRFEWRGLSRGGRLKFCRHGCSGAYHLEGSSGLRCGGPHREKPRPLHEARPGEMHTGLDG